MRRKKKRRGGPCAEKPDNQLGRQNRCYSWGMTSNKRGCEAQTPSLVPPIEASPLLLYSHCGQPNGGVRRPSPNQGSNGGVGRPSPNECRTAGSGDPRRTSAERRGRETLAERMPNGGVKRPSPNECRTAGSGDPRRTSTSCGGSAKSLECPVMRSPWSNPAIGWAPW